MSDTAIMSTVCRLLATLLDELDLVQVEVERGVVYLEGIARTAAQKQRIEDYVRQVPGVHDVVNCLALEHIAQLPPDYDAPLFLSAILDSGQYAMNPERFGRS